MEGSLADAARTRRERLAAMRAAAGGAPEPKRSRMAPPSETAPAVEAQEQEVTLKFRNYQPTDDAIKDVAETVVADGVSLQAVVEEKIKEQEAAGEADIHQLDSSDLLNLVPQKVDWWVSRDLVGCKGPF